MEPSHERTVVVGVDGSTESLVAARYALHEAALRELDVELVYSYPLPLMQTPVSGSFVDDFAAAGRSILDEAVAALEVPPSVALTTQVADALPALAAAARRTRPPPRPSSYRPSCPPWSSTGAGCAEPRLTRPGHTAGHRRRP